MKAKIDIIAGARPNFMKVAAIFAVADAFPQCELRLIHTGQHYDSLMSEVFFKELKIPEPMAQLNVGSGSHAVQTAEVMKGYEAWVRQNRPELTVVVGDVNSTVACALVAAKEGIRVAHVEAGLRSFDRSMPEEVNRVITDSISDLMFDSEPSGIANLAKEGRPVSSAFLVGNVMIDTLLRMLPLADEARAYERYGVEPGGYAYVTLHRPSNVDDPKTLEEICQQLLHLSSEVPIVFPAHPRTRKNLLEFRNASLVGKGRITVVEPVSYLESLSLAKNAMVVITDSGGLQEESSAMGIPCLTLRHNTERPITVDEGTNTLIGGDWKLFRECCERIKKGTYCLQRGSIPYWDGRSGERILRQCVAFC